MQSTFEELELSRQVWERAVLRLQQKIVAALRNVHPDFVDANMDVDERTESVPCMEREITIYRMCIDWARVEQEILSGTFNEKQVAQRQRFYKLMAVLAKAELDRDDRLRSVAYVSSASVEHPSNQETVDQLASAASSALKLLIEAA